MAIIDLTSCDLRDNERISLVAHSFRVMAKSRNYDELVVGMMHDMYSISSYARGLFSCDVDGDPKWKDAAPING